MFRRISTATFICVILAGSAVVMAQKVAKELEDVVNSASNFADWKPEDSMYPKEDEKLALENGRACIAKIDEATSRGLTESTQVETHKGNMTITEARAMCVKARRRPDGLRRPDRGRRSAVRAVQKDPERRQAE